MSKKTYVLPFFIGLLIVVGSCSTNDSRNVESLSLTFNEEMVIGGPSQPDTAFLSSPNSIRTDSRQRIYISDGKQSTIMVYSPDGEHLYSIGREGRGPGEFERIPPFIITEEDELVALDSGNRRVIWFSLSGEEIKTVVPESEQMVWNNKFSRLNNGNFVLLDKPRSMGDDQPGYRSNVLHLYNSDFSSRLQSFGHIDSLLTDAASDFVPIYTTSTNAGNMLVVSGDELWYTPGIYNGQIFSFQKSGEDDSWHLRDTLGGMLKAPMSVAADSETEGASTISVYTSEGQMSASGRVYSKSRGLYMLQDGRRIHVSSQEVNDTTRTVIEVFNSEGTLEGAGTVEAFKYPDNDFGSYSSYLWMDQTGRFYFIDSEQAVVRVGRLEGL